MQEAIILKETKFCKLMKINSVSPDIFSVLIVHTSYLKRHIDFISLVFFQDSVDCFHLTQKLSIRCPLPV